MTFGTGPETMNDLLQATVFSGAQGWDGLIYLGPLTPKILRFEAVQDVRVRPLYLASVVSRDEKIAWQSFQDLLGHAVEMAQTGMAGLFGLEVLSVDIQNGIRHFHAGDLSRLLINHSRKQEGEFKTLVRYGQLFCLLHKRAPADWGKVELRTYVEIIDPGKTRLDLFVKKLLRESRNVADAIYWIHGLSAAPVWKGWKETSGAVPVPGAPEVRLFQASLKTTRCLDLGTC